MKQKIESIIKKISVQDVKQIFIKESEYNSGWRSYPFSPFANLERKWSRIRTVVEESGGGNLFDLIKADPRLSGIIDDVGDLRHYLILVEAELYRPENESADEYIKRVSQQDVLDLTQFQINLVIEVTFRGLEVSWLDIERLINKGKYKYDILSVLKHVPLKAERLLDDVKLLRWGLHLLHAQLLHEGVKFTKS